MKKKFQLSYTKKRKLNGFLYVLPFLIGFLICFLIPLYNTFMYSFNTVSVKDTGGMNFTFVGFQNYIDLFTKEVTATTFPKDQPMLRMFTDQNWYILMNFPLIVIFSLFMALLANMKFRGRAIIRVIFFLPIILGLDIVVQMLAITTGGEWAQQGSGLFSNSSLSEMLFYYTNIPETYLLMLIGYMDRIFDVIAQSGVQTLIYLAALQSISPSLYEVAKIEGATAYETFWKVTIPSIMHITLFVTIYTAVDMFLTSPISEEAYYFAFKSSKIGTGSALSVIYIINVMLVLGLILLVMRKVVKRYEK